ncbi:MAG: tetratricopeptide repeat protein [Burkholderiales bacterium]|nr:tetratricopeptide repeat protein [Burkholderiales bacterium]
MKHTYILALLLALYTGLAQANLGDTDVQASDNADLKAGRTAIDKQDWKAAVDHLSKAAAAEPNNADVHNWLGYANRNLGNMDAAFAAYGEALRLDPRNRYAHEYIGEAYLMVDDLGKAEGHLAELQKLCTPIPCEEYKDLKRAVDEYKAKK